MPGWVESEMPNHQEYGLKCFMFHVSCLMDLSRMFVADTLTFLYCGVGKYSGWESFVDLDVELAGLASDFRIKDDTDSGWNRDITSFGYFPQRVFILSSVVCV